MSTLTLNAFMHQFPKGIQADPESLERLNLTDAQRSAIKAIANGRDKIPGEEMDRVFDAVIDRFDGNRLDGKAESVGASRQKSPLFIADTLSLLKPREEPGVSSRRTGGRRSRRSTSTR